MNNRPWDFDQSRSACREASQAQAAAEELMRESAATAAIAEEQYRVALAKKILELHGEGTAWSACADVARGDVHVAELRRKRDIAEGVREASIHVAWRRAADRKDVQRFVDWSMRRELAEAGQPAWSPEVAA